MEVVVEGVGENTTADTLDFGGDGNCTSAKADDATGEGRDDVGRDIVDDDDDCCQT